MTFQFVDITKKIENFMGSVKATQFALLSYYSPMIKNEIKLSQPNENSKILCIGGGCLPCTAILFNKYTKAKITAIDIDEQAIITSKKRLNKLGLSDQIIIKKIDGKEIDASEFDIIHIALQVNPKDEVINQIKKSMKKSAKILIRIPKKAIAKGYHNIDFMTENSVKQPFYSNIGRTYLYVD